MALAAIVLFLLQDEPAPSPVSPARQTFSLTSPLEPRDVALVPWSYDVLQRADLDRTLARSTPEAFEELRGVSARRTAYGWSAPVVRGLSGNRVVFLIDGVRLNNGAWCDESGWNTVDPHLFDRFELVRGPAGVVWGSDASGGTFHGRTREPSKLPESFEFRMDSAYRYAGAEGAHSIHTDVGTVSSSGAVFLGATYRKSDDLVAGRSVGELPETAYDQVDFDTKALISLGDDASLILAVQGSRQHDMPVTHRTVFGRPSHGTVAGSDLKNELDNERDLVYLQIRCRPEGALVDGLHLSISYHRQNETLLRIDSVSTRSDRETEVRSGGFFVHASKKTDAGLFTFGADIYADVVNTAGSDTTSAGVVTKFDRGDVADNSVYDLGGLFVQDEVTLSKQVDLVVGLRWIWTRINAERIDPAGVGAAPFEPFERSYSGVGGDLRLLWHIDEHVKLIAGVAEVFRAPNLYETTALRYDDFPNQDLDPEQSHEINLGVRGDYESITAGVTLFHSWLDGWIARRPEPSFGPSANVFDNFDGTLWGVEAYFEMRLADTWTVWSDVSWTVGDVDTAGDEEPITGMNPASFHLGLRYRPKGETYYIEGVMTAIHHQNRLSPADESDLTRIGPEGTPGYTIATVRGGIEFLTNIRATAAVENFANKEYRIHGSGINGAGTNFVIGIDVKF